MRPRAGRRGFRAEGCREASTARAMDRIEIVTGHQRKGPTRMPNYQIGSRYPDEQSPRSAFAHYQGIAEGDHSAARSRIWPDDGSGRAGGAGCVRCRAGRRPACRGAIAPGRGLAPLPPQPDHRIRRQPGVAIILAARISLRVDDARYIRGFSQGETPGCMVVLMVC